MKKRGFWKRGFWKGKKAWNKGLHITELHRLHISQATLGQPKPWLRKPFTKKYIKNLSKALKGVPKSEATKRKMSLNHNYNVGFKRGHQSPWKGKHLSEIHRLKLSKALMGHPNYRKKK